ncbi:MAG TPA: hypothetical protein VEC18_09675 [Myxococcota bacterium]|nr:hypothetical protein [Myxococcota bacterium]
MEEGTLAAAIECFARRGYTGGFRAVDGGLRDVRSGRVYRPEQLQIDEVARFEGMSDPDEQVAAFALSDATGENRGVYVVAFGPSIDRLDADAVQRLRDARFSGFDAIA